MLILKQLIIEKGTFRKLSAKMCAKFELAAFFYTHSVTNSEFNFFRDLF